MKMLGQRKIRNISFLYCGLIALLQLLFGSTAAAAPEEYLCKHPGPDAGNELAVTVNGDKIRMRFRGIIRDGEQILAEHNEVVADGSGEVIAEEPRFQSFTEFTGLKEFPEELNLEFNVSDCPSGIYSNSIVRDCASTQAGSEIAPGVVLEHRFSTKGSLTIIGTAMQDKPIGAPGVDQIKDETSELKTVALELIVSKTVPGGTLKAKVELETICEYVSPWKFE